MDASMVVGPMDAGVDPSADASSAEAGPAPGDASAPAVKLPPGVRGMFPLPGASGLCNDPPLRIEFSAPPSLGSRGRIRVWRDDQPSTPAASIDLGAGTQAVMRGGQSYQQPPAAFVDGNAAVFALPPGALMRG